MSIDLESQLMEITDTFVKGEVDEAFARMAVLEQTCHSDRERSQVMARYVTFFHLLEMRDEELSALAQALLLDQTNPRANYLNALHLMSDERWEDAVIALNTAARYYPLEDKVHLAEVYGNLSYCWEQLEDSARADMYREIATDLDPEGVTTIQGEEGCEWPEDLEPESFDVPEELDGPDQIATSVDLSGLDALDADDEDENLTNSARVERMLRDMGAKPGRARGVGATPARDEAGGKGAKGGAAKGGAAKGGAAKGGTAKSGAAKGGAAKSGPAKGPHAKGGPAKPGPGKGGPAKSAPVRPAASKVVAPAPGAAGPKPVSPSKGGKPPVVKKSAGNGAPVPRKATDPKPGSGRGGR